MRERNDVRIVLCHDARDVSISSAHVIAKCQV